MKNYKVEMLLSALPTENPVVDYETTIKNMLDAVPSLLWPLVDYKELDRRKAIQSAKCIVGLLETLNCLYDLIPEGLKRQVPDDAEKK